MNRYVRRLLVLAALGGLLTGRGVGQEAAAADGADAEVKAFETLCNDMMKKADSLDEAAVIQMLDTSTRLRKPYVASLALARYLDSRLEPSVTVLRKAIDNAVLLGDYQTVAGRCKKYLQLAQPGADASDVAALLYYAQVGFLDATDDAYRTIRTSGGKHRQSLNARKFDGWFLDEAARRRDFPALAERLVLVYGDKLPVAQEREYYGDKLDLLMAAIKIPLADRFDAAPHCAKLATLVRDGKRKAQLLFYTANLAFKAGAKDKEAAALDAEFRSVISAAHAWFAQYPSFDVLEDILLVFGDGNPNVGWRQNQVAAKQAFFAKAFDGVSDTERQALMGSPVRSYFATREQWVELGMKHAELFKRSPETASLSFVIGSQNDTPELYIGQSRFLTGVQSSDAAIINSLAAGGMDLNKALDHLMKNEAWHLPSNATWLNNGVINQMWPIFSRYPRDEANRLPNDYFTKAMARFGVTHAASTPLAMDDAFVSEALLKQWSVLEDKTQIKTALAAYDWVTWSDKQRQSALARTHGEFQRWADAARKNHTAVEKRAADVQARIAKSRQELAAVAAELSALTPALEWKKSGLEGSKAAIEKELDRLGAEKVAADADLQKVTGGLADLAALEAEFARVSALTGDPNRAPNAYCKAWAQLNLAQRNQDTAGFTTAARALYGLVANPGAGKLPMSKEAMTAILRPSVAKEKGMDIFPLQCAILEAELAKWDSGGDHSRIRQVADSIMTSVQGWNWGQLPAEDKDKALKLNAIFEKAVGAQLGKGNWKPLFDMMMLTRSGRGWAEYGLNEALMERIVKERLLPVSTLMSTMRSGQFPGLVATYPRETYFDDAWLAEAASGRMDVGYWDQGGQDTTQKLRDHVAGVLAGAAALPLELGPGKAAMTRAEFSRWRAIAMGASVAARDAMLARESAYYGQSRFDPWAMGHNTFEIANAGTPEGRKAYFDALSAYLDRVAGAPIHSPFPWAIVMPMRPVRGQIVTPSEAAVLLRLFSPAIRPPVMNCYDAYYLATMVQDALVEGGRENELYGLAPYFWKIAKDNNEATLQSDLTKFSQKLAQDGKNELAILYSGSGLTCLGAGLSGATRTALTAVRARALTSSGFAVPVDKKDPRYQLFAAQADYLSGNLQRAWQTYLGEKNKLLSAIQELDPSFVTWIVKMHSQSSEFDTAISTARALMTLIDTSPENYSAETRAMIILAYADISYHQMDYPKARAMYAKLVASKEFDETRGQVDARFRVVDVDRLTGQFDEAIKSLEEMLRDKRRYVQQEAYYNIALVKFEMGEEAKSLEYLQRVYALNPNHAQSRILEGRINIAQRDYEKASDIRVGEAMDLDIIVPGKSLRISLSDENLSVIGKNTRLAVRVWADSGDSEELILTPFADSQTLFEGEIATILGAPEKGDRILQVLGNDRVHYDFTDDFKKEQNITVAVKHSLSVVSDSQLLTSSGEILTGEALELKQLRDSALSARGDRAGSDVALSTVRARNQIKPGNSINVRVVDHDRSVTPQKDTLTVRVSTTSGDSIPAFTLTETDTHSGVFEGAIPTETATATAFASDSMEGREPNWAISSGSFPAWIGRADDVRPKWFSVDLNDMVALGTLSVEAREAGHKLKDFSVLISRNGKVFEPVACWPVAPEPWDGSPVMTMMTAEQGTPNMSGGLVTLVGDAMDATSWSRKSMRKLSSMSVVWDQAMMKQADALKIGGNQYYRMRVSAGFYVDRVQTRTFKLNPKSSGSFQLLVDGQPCAKREGSDPLRDFSGQLKKGVHRVDILVWARRDHKPVFDLLCDEGDAGVLTVCPPEMFDTTKHPEIAGEFLKDAVSVIPRDDAAAFDIKFSPGTEARVVKLSMHDFETDSPAINKISLTSAGGDGVLPTLSNLMALRENQTLEIVPGDRVSVVYEDPKTIGKNGKVRESFLSATYANASLNAVFVEANEVGPRYVPLRRFTPGSAVAVMINDPDRDVSAKPDVVEFRVQTTGGTSRALKALETSEHSGVFVGRFFPVAGAPGRESEVTVETDDEVVISYLDEENMDPGIPWVREITIEQARYVTPQLRVGEMTSRNLTEEELGLSSGNVEQSGRTALAPPAGGQPTKSLEARFPEEQAEGAAAQCVLGGPVLVELLWPTIATSGESKATLYLQTASARNAHQGVLKEPFDESVKGTIRVEAGLSGGGGQYGVVPPGYDGYKIVGRRYAGRRLKQVSLCFASTRRRIPHGSR